MARNATKSFPGRESIKSYFFSLGSWFWFPGAAHEGSGLYVSSFAWSSGEGAKTGKGNGLAKPTSGVVFQRCRKGSSFHAHGREKGRVVTIWRSDYHIYRRDNGSEETPLYRKASGPAL
jgi:hypothetical protein